MIQSLNQEINVTEMDQTVDQMFEELENRSEFVCKGYNCNGNNAVCGMNN